MSSPPNHETIRHLCHFYKGTEYYLFVPDNDEAPILVTDVKDLEKLKQELISWCGMEIEVFNPHHCCSKVTLTLQKGIALHRVAEHMDLVEESRH
jgi:hypothetical protein